MEGLASAVRFDPTQPLDDAVHGEYREKVTCDACLAQYVACVRSGNAAPRIMALRRLLQQDHEKLQEHLPYYQL
jgi:hypothetical protein